MEIAVMEISVMESSVMEISVMEIAVMEISVMDISVIGIPRKNLVSALTLNSNGFTIYIVDGIDLDSKVI